MKAHFADAANRYLKRHFEDIFELNGFDVSIDGYDFPTQFDQLGQVEGNDYFAIVHVDGNNMGKRFRDECKTLTDRRKLSREIKRKTEGAFAQLLVRIIKMIERDGFKDAIDLNENILPIRPLIIGGDDITFVCPATTALMFTGRHIFRTVPRRQSRRNFVGGSSTQHRKSVRVHAAIQIGLDRQQQGQRVARRPSAWQRRGATVLSTVGISESALADAR